MFLDKYLSETKLDMLYSIYDDNYIYSIDYNNFMKIYNIFNQYQFYFIDDIIVNYLEIFTLDAEEVITKLEILKYQLGEKFVYIIGNDMRYLESLLRQ